MKAMKLLLAAGVVVLAAGAQSGPAKAGHSHFGFGYLGPGFSFHVGPLPRRRWYGPRYYRPFYYEPYYRSYAPRPYVPPPGAGRCGYWSGQCAANWGAHNADYYGCLRYHGCN